MLHGVAVKKYQEVKCKCTIPVSVITSRRITICQACGSLYNVVSQQSCDTHVTVMCYVYSAAEREANPVPDVSECVQDMIREIVRKTLAFKVCWALVRVSTLKLFVMWIKQEAINY